MPCFRRDSELATSGQGLPARLLPPNFACGEGRSWHSTIAHALTRSMSSSRMNALFLSTCGLNKIWLNQASEVHRNLTLPNGFQGRAESGAIVNAIKVLHRLESLYPCGFQGIVQVHLSKNYIPEVPGRTKTRNSPYEACGFFVSGRTGASIDLHRFWRVSLRVYLSYPQTVYPQKDAKTRALARRRRRRRCSRA